MDFQLMLSLGTSSAFPVPGNSLQSPLFDAGNIAAADVQQFCSFQLGQRRLAGKTIPQQNDLSLPGGQAVQQLPHPADIVLRFAGVLHAEAVLQHIGQRQRRVTI